MRDADRSYPVASGQEWPLRGFAEVLTEGVFRASPTGQILAANEVFRELLSLANEASLASLRLTEFFGEDILKTGLGRTSLVTPVLDRHTGRELLLTLVPGQDGEGHAVIDGVLAVPDQSRRPRTGEIAPERSAEVERFESIGRMAGSVAHDIANLVTTISGYGSLLQKTLSEHDPRHPDVDGILTAAERCCGLARQLLDAGRAPVLSAPLSDVSAITDQLMGVLQRLVADKGQLLWRRSARTLFIGMDRLQFEQVLLNLVTNARDALHVGGTLKIEALVSAVLPGDECLPPGDYVCLSVTDEGAGMEAETVERIFDPFFSTKAPEASTGLGLSTVRSIVKQHKGDIRVVSTPGQGSRFTVLLPRLN